MIWQGYFRGMILAMLVASVLLLSACEQMKEMGIPVPSSGDKSTLTAAAPQEEGQIKTKGPKKRIAVMRFDVKATDTHGYRQVDLTAAEMLTTALFKTGEFIVVERSVLDRILKEQGSGLSGFVDQSTAAKVGKVLGLQALVTGSVTHIGFEESESAIAGVGWGTTTANVDLDIRVIDATTAKVLIADSGSGTNSTRNLVTKKGRTKKTADRNNFIGKALRDAAKDISNKIVGQMSTVEWTGRIARIKGRDVYINAGTDLGLETGYQLSVFRPGDTVKDPSTGEILGVEETPIGQLLVTSVQDRFAIATPKGGVGFKRNDMVRLTK